MKERLRLLVLFPILVLLAVFAVNAALSSPAAPAAPTAVLTLDAVGDTFISQAVPGENYGGLQALTVAYTDLGWAYRSLIQFDLASLPPGSAVVSATLEVYLPGNKAASGQIFTVWADRSTAAWQEMTVTWLTRPGYESLGDPYTDIGGQADYWVAWDVTNVVAAWVDGSRPNYGFVLHGEEAPWAVGFADLASRESLAVPRLTISYIHAPPTATGTQFTATPGTPVRTATRTATPTNTRTPTGLPSPTPPGVGSCPGTVIVYPDRDTWTSEVDPTRIGGRDAILDLFSGSAGSGNVYLHFPVEAFVPPGQSVYQATLVLRTRFSVGTAPLPWQAILYTLNGPIDESTTSWNNQPGPSLLVNLVELVQAPPGEEIDQEINVLTAVRAWASGADPNHGLGIFPLEPDGSFTTYWASREWAANPPYILIECGSQTPTPNPTVTPVPTRTPTPTPTAYIPPTCNAMALDLEITQGVQDLQQSVRLINYRPTYARLYPCMQNYPGWARLTAELDVYMDGVRVGTLSPINSYDGRVFLPGCSFGQNATRTTTDWNFLFEIPSAYTVGDVTFKAEVNPDRLLAETVYYDNTVERSVTFEPVRTINLVVYQVTHEESPGTIWAPTMDQIMDSRSMAMVLLPLGPYTGTEVRALYRTREDDGELTLERLVSAMQMAYVWDGSPKWSRYYGLAHSQDEQGNIWSGGLSGGIPASWAAGYTGNAKTMAHELGHTFGRHHTQSPYYDDRGKPDIGCKAGTGCWVVAGAAFCHSGFEDYPYSGGYISPTSNEWLDRAVFGFAYNYQDQSAVIAPNNWKDIMTYCAGRWTSDFTYGRIMSFIGQVLDQEPLLPAIAPTAHLLISGYVYSDTGTVYLEPLFVITPSEVLTSTPGTYAIVQRDGGGGELARYPFTPEPAACGDENLLLLSELVPWVDGTAQVDIERAGEVLTSVSSGASAPTITLTAPNGGEVLAGDFVTVTWAAADPDSDPLVVNIDYSADGGTTWTLVAMGVSGNVLAISRTNVPCSEQGLFRAWVSDGMHTARDTSDAPFTVANRAPHVTIIAPPSGSNYLLSQTVSLQAWGYDLDDDWLLGDALSWYSSRDGFLGHGDDWSVATLSAGQHTILVSADDGDGGTAADVITITVYADPAHVPPPANSLRAGPAVLSIDANGWGPDSLLFTRNVHEPVPLGWTVTASEPWVQLSTLSGSTPQTVTVTIDWSLLVPGYYSATITFTNSANPQEQVPVEVYVQARRFEVFLPVVMRPDR